MQYLFYLLKPSQSSRQQYPRKSEDRAHRIGQKKTVTYIDLICEDTVDEKIEGSKR